MAINEKLGWIRKEVASESFKKVLSEITIKLCADNIFWAENQTLHIE
jgi:hypothetical protein